MRRRLRQAYFDERVSEAEGDARASWEVQREVNRARRRLRRAYFDQRVREAEGDARASWEVLREVIGWGRGNRGMGPCGYFEKGGEGVMDKGEIVAGFCDFFMEVGLRLVAGVRRER